MTREDCDIIEVDHWQCPEGTGVPLITMPNVPRALHGQGMQPRTIYGPSVWNFMRKKAYYNADYKCEICGCEPAKGQLHAHELFSYDYMQHEGRFERCVAICAKCHNAIHSGRLISMFKRNNPLYPKSYVLKVVEHCFKQIYEYNKTHDEELRVYATFVDYLREPELKEEMSELIKKFNIKFYTEKLSKRGRWKGWHVHVGNKTVMSPYKSQSDWERAMLEMQMRDTIRNVETPFKGEGFDAINEILKESKKTP